MSEDGPHGLALEVGPKMERRWRNPSRGWQKPRLECERLFWKCAVPGRNQGRLCVAQVHGRIFSEEPMTPAKLSSRTTYKSLGGDKWTLSFLCLFADTAVNSLN